MKIAVISDLHLGSNDPTDQFGHDDGKFLGFLDHLEDNFERIVLLGDVYETLTCRSPFAQAKELERVQGEHKEIVRRFDRDAYRYVHGNHDLVAGNLLGAPDQLEIVADGQRILFTHGHWFDWMVQRARIISEFGCFLGGWLLRFGFRPLFRFFEWFDSFICSVGADKASSVFQRWAVDVARERNADIIVTGHTHVGARMEHGDRLFLNSGSCAKGTFSFLSIDTAQGNYALNSAW